MLDTFLFDLDGTLLPLDTDQFMKIYFNELGKAFHDIIEPKTLTRSIWNATEAMVRSTEHQTNEEVFMERFFSLIEGDKDTYMQRFNAFYDNEFMRVKSSVQDMPLIKECINMLKEKGYQLVLATNPIFPRKAIHHRIRWAGLDPKDFIYITSYEQNHYCKPQLKYYEEILKDIGKNPEQCIMVGNDVQEDLVVSKLDIKTYLITNHIINRSKDAFTSDYQGTYEDFYEFVQKIG
ncbi:MAG: HAD family hydrolase [Clostridia bacterium]